jgi:DNA-directed RNA polymerase omega subunit
VSKTDNITSRNNVAIMAEDQWPLIDSRYRLIIVAALRSKQLQRGAIPRIEADPRKHRSTSIALEEVKQGLVPFTITDENKRGLALRMGRHMGSNTLRHESD